MHRFASAELRSGIQLPSNVLLRGGGKRATVLQVTGTSACTLLLAENRNSIALEDLKLVGNGVTVAHGSVYGIGGALRWTLTDRARSGVAGLALRRIHLENFRTPWWIEVQNLSGSGLAMADVSVEELSFVGRPGNSIARGDLRINSAVLCINGSSGAVSDVDIRGFAGDARHLKTGIILYHHIERARLAECQIADAGREGAEDDCGGYAIQIYDAQDRMHSVELLSPRLDRPRSAGIYVVGGKDVTITDPVICGQTDPRDGTLPKGAIALNGTREWTIAGARFGDNWRDLDVVAPDFGSEEAPFEVAGLVVDLESSGSLNGCRIQPKTGRVGSGIRFEACRWRTRERTLLVQNRAGVPRSGERPEGGYVDAVCLAACRLEAAPGFRAVDLWGDSGSPAGGYVIDQCNLVGTNALYARDQGGTLHVRGCDIRDHGTRIGTAATTLLDCAALLLEDSSFSSPGPQGIGVNLAGSIGSVHGLTFPECTHVLPPEAGAAQLGGTRPSFAGIPGQFVQRLTADSASDVAGWRCEGARNWIAVAP